MIISIIVAASENNVIGNKGKIPWHLPADLKHFKKITSGHHVIMGQTTHESIGKPLPERVNIVLTKDKNFESNGCTIAYSLKEALEIARKAGEKEVFIIGGGSVYEQALPLANKIYLTKVNIKVDGDTYFPQLDPMRWKLTSCITQLSDSQNPYPYNFCIYEKRF